MCDSVEKSRRNSSEVDVINKQIQDDYNDAVRTLNKVQDASHLTYKDGASYFKLAQQFAKIGNILGDKLDELAAIHVAGTKGKGSVCAYCESVMRHSGYKTGFYSSPHLIEVRERMRINGKPITKHLFTRYFWEFWKFYENCELGLPSYKMFMTFMAFYVFLKEKVDVAIIEVGLGGEYDPTNIIRAPYVCGVTQLELDHLKSLGGSIESIAWHKSGIFKPGIAAFTIEQNASPMKVLTQRAKERKTLLQVVPDNISTWSNDSIPALGFQSDHQVKNALLALYLCRAWLRKKECNDEKMRTPCDGDYPPIADTFTISDNFLNGIRETKWPGRSQCIERANTTIYIDGAHTLRSMEACSSWFSKKANEEKTRKKTQRVGRILIFNFKGERDAVSLLKPLVHCDIDYVVFCPNILTRDPFKGDPDIIRVNLDVKAEKQRCYDIQNTWKQVVATENCVESKCDAMDSSRVFHCVSDAVQWCLQDHEPTIVSCSPLQPLPECLSRCDHVQILVTGSLYLCGLVMKVLGPNMVEL